MNLLNTSGGTFRCGRSNLLLLWGGWRVTWPSFVLQRKPTLIRLEPVEIHQAWSENLGDGFYLSSFGCFLLGNCVSFLCFKPPKRQHSIRCEIYISQIRIRKVLLIPAMSFATKIQQDNSLFSILLWVPPFIPWSRLARPTTKSRASTATKKGGGTTTGALRNRTGRLPVDAWQA